MLGPATRDLHARTDAGKRPIGPLKGNRAWVVTVTVKLLSELACMVIAVSHRTSTPPYPSTPSGLSRVLGFARGPHTPRPLLGSYSVVQAGQAGLDLLLNFAAPDPLDF